MNSFSHLVITGRQPEFGLLELESILGPEAVSPYGRYGALITSTLNLNRLGSAQKLGRILYHGPAADLLSVVDTASLPQSQGKTVFGLSYYGVKATTRFVLATGLELKKSLKIQGKSVRFVTPTEGTALTAAQIIHNHLLSDGFELIVVVNGQQMVVAINEAVQDIAWYGRRDYDRPARSAKVGMLPPKLAQILVNTTTAPTVFDPFCGTGVVLQEALLMGRSAVASDLSPEMTDATRQNLEWLASERPLKGTWDVKGPIDAREVVIPDPPLALVSEGYLGPNLISKPDTARLMALRSELKPLYLKALSNWGQQSPAGAEVSICVPTWRTNAGWEQLLTVDELPDIGYTCKVFKHVPGPIIYGRPDQIVGRQLLILRKS